MKRLLLSIATMLSAFGLMAGVAAAQSSSCTIQNTGSGSVNITKCQNKSQFTITCTNNTIVYINNKQTANSGSSVTVNNTGGTYTTSTGDAVNVNNSNIATNVSCAPATQASATPVTTTPPSTGNSSKSGAPAPAKVQALPNTGSDSLVAGSALAVAALAVAGLAARFGLAVYQRVRS